MNTLFKPLRLPSEDSCIDQFIRTHILFSHKVRLDEATFWTTSQASFIKESLDNDSE